MNDQAGVTGENKGDYFQEAEYYQAIDVLRAFTNVALRWLGEKTPDRQPLWKHRNTKDEILMYFCARGSTTMEGIQLLWQARDFGDCWALHRSLAERYLLLLHLIERDEFAAFDRWSLDRRVKDVHDAISDPEIRSKMPHVDLQSAKILQRERRSELEGMPQSDWKPPRAEKIAKEMDQTVLYRAGYDLGSSKLHPKAGDGKGDYARLVGLEQDTQEDDLAILHNSFYIQSGMLKLGLRSASVMWVNYARDFLEQCHSWLASGSLEYRESFTCLERIPPTISWCQPDPDY